MSISAAQCRAARALLDWSQDQLAENAQVARATIADFERNTRMPIRNNLISIVGALEAAGVAFIPENGEGVGVRFRKVELEYSRTVRIKGDDCILPVRYRGKAYSAIIPREVMNDIDRATYRTAEDRVNCVQKHLPVFLRTTEEKIIAGDISGNDQVLLTHDSFPDGTF